MKVRDLEKLLSKLDDEAEIKLFDAYGDGELEIEEIFKNEVSGDFIIQPKFEEEE